MWQGNEVNTQPRSKAQLLLPIGLLIALLIGSPAWPAGQVLAVGAPPHGAATAVEMAQLPAFESEMYSLDDPHELESFLDGVLIAQMSALHIPGVVVAVVKEGKPLFAKGYGYADLETLSPVDADRTLFRVGSVSKLFPWTAVMQLVEQGRLDLDADVNAYLDFRIPATYPQSITLRHLMTHTPGFEDRGLGLYVASADNLVPLGQYLADNIPARVYPPGEIAAYSNYGAALAGYIVEQVSGMPFEQYVEDHISQPLRMARSTFRQTDIPSDLAADMAVGYTYANGAFNADGPSYATAFPAGSLSSTATDMAKFMIAHLQGGRYGKSRILQEATVQEMHRQQYANHPGVSGITLGFMESNANSLRIVGHGGDTKSFHSLLSLIPEQNVGLFISYSRRDRERWGQ